MRQVIVLLVTFLSLVVAVPVGSAPKGIWVKNCIGKAEAAGDVTIEEAKQRALENAKAEAARRAYGEKIIHDWDDILIQFGGEANEFTRRTTIAQVAGLVIDFSVPQYKLEPASTDVVRVVCQADFLVAELPETQKAFGLELTIDHPEVVSGSPIRLKVRSQADAYVHVFNLAADLKIYQLYPNRYRTEVPVDKGRWVEFPSPEDPFDMVPRTLPGRRMNIEVLKAVATRRPTQPPAGPDEPVIPLRRYYDWQLGLERGSWAEAEVKYTVHASRLPEK